MTFTKHKTRPSETKGRNEGDLKAFPVGSRNNLFFVVPEALLSNGCYKVKKVEISINS